MKDPKRFDQWVGVGVGIFVGGTLGAMLSVAFCNWVYAGSGAGAAGGGDGIETVIAGWICFGIFGAMVGAVLGGIVAFKASRDDQISNGDQLDQPGNS